MNVLFIDFCFFSGHKHLNLNHLKILNKICNLTVISETGYYPTDVLEGLDHVQLIEFKKYIPRNRNRLTFRIKAMVNMIRTLKAMKNCSYDKIVVASFETITFSILAPLFYNKSQIFLFHHQNTDEMSSKFKMTLFKYVIHKVNHIVLDEFIREHLIKEFNLDPDRVSTTPHPLKVYNDDIPFNTTPSTVKTIVAISGSNDKQILRKLIDDYQNQIQTIDSQTQFIIKLKNSNFKDDKLITINKYLSVEEYESYYQNAHIIWLPFPKNYRYRLSGTMIDALSTNKIVVGSNIPCFQTYSKRYPSLCKVADSIDELLQISQSCTYNNAVIAETGAFKNAHSTSQLVALFENILSSTYSIE
jgi:hypothetical protein